MNLNELDLTHASRVYAISNTPLFLVRKLQEDPSVLAISQKYSGEEIVNALRDAVKTEPDNSIEAVFPYVLLLALFLKPTIDHLQEASKIQTAIYEWYAYIVDALLMRYSPFKHETIQVPGVLSSPSVSLNSDSPNSFKIVDAA